LLSIWLLLVAAAVLAGMTEAVVGVLAVYLQDMRVLPWVLLTL
jgi:hypothetical protein